MEQRQSGFCAIEQKGYLFVERLGPYFPISFIIILWSKLREPCAGCEARDPCYSMFRKKFPWWRGGR